MEEADAADSGTDVFSCQWLETLKEEWNQERGLASQLRQINFTSVVAFGLPDEEMARAYLIVRGGEIKTVAFRYDSTPDWDIRAQMSQWQEWLIEPPGLLALGMAFTQGLMQFRKGSYPAMIKDPLMADSFVRSFALMSKAYTNVVNK